MIDVISRGKNIISESWVAEEPARVGGMRSREQRLGDNRFSFQVADSASDQR